MDRELWRTVLGAVRRAAGRVDRELPWHRRPVFADWLVAAVHLWAVWHDRTLTWACDRAHYGRLFRPRKLPGVSQLSRRVRSDRLQRVLQYAHDELAGRGVVTDAGYLDGKPLTVGPATKDRDARRGRVPGGFGKGYKLHAFVSERRRVVVWSVVPLNVDEKAVAAELLPHLPPLAPGAVVLADANYDAAPLHKAVAAAADAPRLVTPLKGQARVGPGGHHPVTRRQMGAARRELVAAWAACPGLTGHVLKARDEVERAFGVLASTAGGLGPLPAWVRTLGRVRRWVGAKIILYNARLRVQAEQATRAVA